MSLRRRRIWIAALLIVVSFSLGVATTMAQTTYGAVRGIVKDPQGAALVGATVTLVNEGTKIARKTVSNASGEYNFTSVEPGLYTVMVTMGGFKNTSNRGVGVETGATDTVDLSMQLGGSTETVEVSTAEPLIDTANANGGQSFNSTQLEELPNLGRNPFVFEKLDTATTPVGDPRYVRAEDQTGQSTISVSGAPIGANNFAVDGIPISQSNGGVTFIPSLEAVSDVKVQSNTYDAEVGRTGGGMFNTTLKSGTDQYHGALYGMTRQTNWSANSFTNNRTPYLVNGVQVASQTPRPAVETYLYAGAIGGPVPFSDKVKYLKNTFFWIVEEGYRQAQPLPGSGSYIVPTPAELSGDFSGDTGVTLYDPTTPSTGTGRTPISYMGKANVINPSYISPIGLAIAKSFPACTACSNGGGVNNYFSSDDFKTRSDMYSGKLDHVFTPWWSATLSYVHLATQEPSGSFIHTIDNADGILHRFNDATAYNNVFQLNSTTILTVGYGFNRYYSHQVPYSESGFPGGFNQATGFGGVGFPAPYVALVQSHTFPSIYVNGVGPSGGSSLAGGSTSTASLGTSDSGPTIQSSRNVVIGIAKTVGKQDIKGGYVYRHLSNFQQPLGSSGAFYFDGQYTSANGGQPSAANGGNALADLLMGQPGAAPSTNNGSPESLSQVANAAGNFNQIIAYHALFVQDNFRASQKLTLNLGVRYEYELGQKEAKNQYVVGFDPNIGYVFPCSASAGTACAQAHGGLAFAGQNGYPTHANDFSHAKISPRVGFAYEIRPGTALRGGFGIFYAPVATVTDTTGYSQTTYSAPTGATVTTTSPVGTDAPLSNPFGGASAILAPSGNTLSYLTGTGGSVSVQDFHRKYPLVEQYSLNVEHQLPYGVSIEVGYIGAHSKYFPQNVSINQLTDGQLAQFASGAQTVSTTKVANPYYAPTLTNGKTTYPTTGALASSTIAPAQLLLPYPQFAGNGVTLIESVGYSLYNSLDIKVQKRYHGLTVLSTYTWSSNWDNFYGAASAYSSSLNSTSGPQDNYNLKGEYARAVNDIPNRMTVSATYEVPVGRGRKFFGNMPKLVDYALGGYEINDVSILQNGSPLSITQTNLSSTLGTSGFGGSTQRPTLIGNPCLSGSPESRYNAYFNVAAFAPTPAFTYSTMPRSLPCKGPGYANSDFSVNKTFSIGERVKVQFRAEALNATNTPEFANPGLSFNATQTNATAAPTLTKSSTTGIVQGTVGFNRQIQMGGRITF
ncbi:carboxypeptidase regulatory-like domain-containing protein [Granulicella sp. 5B5]|uniref:carboxypeptidase-like regulatory domain-containing protein n=1 Tax=Granulicella sp. 5B5 TaxID=1617967 RepID=UPI0015F3D9C9|nr:carboxypeptidase-like regulatory domain-containing protein [Granulicella sp. 5B5]QMV18628.1 carboxypeptidase regulatory-like domain-containing protein [Granulicella sp. 5B5]